jgi:heme-degrading monooxygenase HmoA
MATFVLSRSKVQDYARFKANFDEHGATRKAAGSKGARVFRSADNPNEVIILMEWDQLQKARQFAQSQDLKKAMEKAGVADKPDVYFLEETGSSQA